LFYISFAGLGLGLGLERADLGLVTAGLDYNTAQLYVKVHNCTP